MLRVLVLAAAAASASARFQETLLPSLSYKPESYRRSLLAVGEVGGNAANKNILCNLAAVTGNTSAFAFSSASGLANLTVQAIHCNDDYDWVAMPGDYAEGVSVGGNWDYFQSTTQPVTNFGRTVSSFFSAAAQSSAASIYGVHATPSGAGTPTSPAVLVSFLMGMPTIGNIATVWPSPTPPATGVSGAFAALNAPAGLVYLSTTSHGNGAAVSAYTAVPPVTAFAIQYLRNYTSTAPWKDNSGAYNWGIPANFVYLSAPIYHATVTGLAPATKYYYVVGNATVTSVELSFTTPPAPNTAATYPFTIGFIADIGQTANTSATMQSLANQAPNLVLYAGDLVYADNYNMCDFQHNFASLFVNGSFVMYPQPAGISAWPTCQLKWDSWLGVPGIQNLYGSTLVMHSPGNHEIERTVGAVGSDMAQATPTSAYFTYANGDYLYQAYAARFPNGNQAATTPAAGGYGDINSDQYYSQNVGAAHVLTLNTLIPYAAGSPQWAFMVADLAAVNRTATPWLIVVFHMPIYHTYEIPFKSCECVRTAYEPIFMQYGVDFVVNGHVHSYERTHPTFNYTLNSNGPVWIMVGDGGTAEGMAKLFIDQNDPISGQPMCTNSAAGAHPVGAVAGQAIGPTQPVGRITNASVTSANTWKYGPGYQRNVNPRNCSAITFQPAATISPTGGLLPNPVLGPAGGYFCPASQPAWSAYRDPSYGYGKLVLTSATTATYSWVRTIDGGAAAADSVMYTRLALAAPGATAYVSASLTLSGYTTATFTAAVGANVVTAVASLLGVPAANVAITAVAAAPGMMMGAGRHLLQSGVSVTFTVTTTAQGATLAALSSVSPDAVTAALTAAGVIATGAALGAPGAVASAPPPATFGTPASAAAKGCTAAAALIGAAALALLL